jgi:hypothetical protein
VIIPDLTGSIILDPGNRTFAIKELLEITNLRGLWVPVAIAGPAGQFAAEKVNTARFDEAARALQGGPLGASFAPAPSVPMV